MGPAWSSVGPVWDRRRALTAAGVAGGHLALLWLVLYFSSFAAPLLLREHTLATVEIADVPSASAPAKPAAASPIRVLDPPVLMPSAIKVPAAPAASGTGTGAGCGMAGVIGRAIAADPAAMAALDALPPGIRTEADAVMLWNGGWIDVGGAPVSARPQSLVPSPVPSLLTKILESDPLAPLKQSVVAALAAAPADCRNLEVSGPQLIPITEPARTTMLVVGSGIWKWADLIDPAVLSPDAVALVSGAPTLSSPPQTSAGKMPLN